METFGNWQNTDFAVAGTVSQQIPAQSASAMPAEAGNRTPFMKRILAIDPGASGGMAWTDGDGQVVIEPMPYSMTEQIDLLRSVVASHPGIRAVLEKVGTYRPGNSGPAAATFARHCGHLEAALYCMGAPTTQVTPKKWQAHLGTMPDDKPERKRFIRDLMARRYPSLSITLKTADALGLFTYAQANL